MEVERIKTGIPGLDDLLKGGIPKNNTVLVSGESGAGKTTFCSQFLWKGLQEGQNCMFISFEEPPSQIKEEAKLFGWDFDKYEDKMTIRGKDPFEEGDEELFWFRDELERKNVQRLAVDSTSILSLYHEDPYEIRKSIYEMIKVIKETDTTAVITAESPAGEDKLTRHDVVQYTVDGVIALYFEGIGEKGYRSLQVRKMRRSDISTETVSFNITNKGLKVGQSIV
ncbi:MAG: RAD55 family ATPase [Candidatus Aenigmatarchaeota archaeon]